MENELIIGYGISAGVSYPLIDLDEYSHYGLCYIKGWSFPVWVSFEKVIVNTIIIS